MTDRETYRARAEQARGRAEAASSASLRAIYNRIARRYAVLAECSDVEIAARGRD